MADERKFSRPRHRAKLARREDVEKALSGAILAELESLDPTTVTGTRRFISTVTAMIASQLTSQTQATQRSILTLGDDAPHFAAAFVEHICAEARKDTTTRIARVTAAAPISSEVLADDWAGPVAGPTLIEQQFGIPRSTLYRWQKKGEIIALNTRSSRKPVFPLRQFQDGRPVQGIAEVILLAGDDRLAWKWLVAPNSELDGRAPIDALLGGDKKVVIALALSECPK